MYECMYVDEQRLVLNEAFFACFFAMMNRPRPRGRADGGNFNVVDIRNSG